MTGADIIGALLREDPDVIELVPVARIKGGRLPENIALPALLVKVVSTVERQKLKRSGLIRTVDRVSVMVRAGSYEDQRSAMLLARACCAGRTGEVAGAKSVSILTAGAGPEIDGPGNSFERTQDFRVSFDA
ncbi:MAG TPA: hypothetical protein VFJ46_17550 [Xanthobacteraceae bacterium]|nr:hypothetical protein [Xanthobacteraceae bacterium]